MEHSQDLSSHFLKPLILLNLLCPGAVFLASLPMTGDLKISVFLFITFLTFQVDCLSQTTIAGCWDGLFDAPSLASLCQAGEARSHSFTSIFRQQDPPRSGIECAIASLLDEINDTTSTTTTNDDYYVEYWWKDSAVVRMLEAHRDIDETLCRSRQVPVALGSTDKVGLQHCPTFGHVLYVNIQNVTAPTLVWQEEQDGAGPPRKLKHMWTVPACSNRLLRFRGDSLHAVSYPALKFLGIDEQDPPSPDQRRAVLLFNTWKKPPSHPAVAEPLSASETKLYESRGGKTECQPMKIWKPTRTRKLTTNNYADDHDAVLSVPLLGDFYRRGVHEDTMESYVGLKAATAALSSSFEICDLELRET